jgi:hypothetical protein
MARARMIPISPRNFTEEVLERPKAANKKKRSLTAEGAVGRRGKEKKHISPWSLCAL